MTKENKELENLPSEQLPNDGGWHWDRLVTEANERLHKIGRHGKRAKIKISSPIKPGKAISAQFKVPGDKQRSYGLNLSLNKNNLVKAEELCSLITGQLVANTFTLDWFYSLIGKIEKVSKKPEKPLTCKEMLEEYKTHYFKQGKDNKDTDNNWIKYYRHIEKTFLKYKNDVLTLKILKETIECTNNNSNARNVTLNSLGNLLKYFDNNDFKPIIKRYKLENNPKPKQKYIPTDTQIYHVYQSGFEINPSCSKRWRYRYAQWQFLYSLLAIYGLRAHEAWNIKNWDEPVTLKAGEWIAIADLEDTKKENEEEQYSYHQIKQNRIIPAILDPNNKDYLLCIGHETKTGYRVAIPMSPSGIARNCDWVQKFNLVQSMNLPDVKEALKRRPRNGTRNCTHATTKWFNPSSNWQKNKRNNTPNKCTLRYGFTAHALRHAYNIRAHRLGITPKMIADSLGHGQDINLTTYKRHEQIESKIEGIEQEVSKQVKKMSKVQELQSQLEQALKQNAYLEDENKHLKAENEKLRTELAMLKAIHPTQPQ